jgi:hypothetical protein
MLVGCALMAKFSASACPSFHTMLRRTVCLRRQIASFLCGCTGVPAMVLPVPVLVLFCIFALKCTDVLRRPQGALTIVLLQYDLEANVLADYSMNKTYPLKITGDVSENITAHMVHICMYTHVYMQSTHSLQC